MRTILFLITLLYIAVVLSMIDNSLEELNNNVTNKTKNKVLKVYKLPKDVREQFDKVIKR